MADPIGSATSIFAGGVAGMLKYWWVILALVFLVIIGLSVWWVGKYKQKNGQWTHKLNVQIELPNGDLDENVKVFKMRRWKHKEENTPPLFELEKPLIGSRIFVELEKYSGSTAYNVILGNDGRLYTATKSIMCKDKNAKEVSVKHAGIDRARQQYNNRFEQMNATPSRIDVLTLMKYGLYATAIIVVLILGITGLKAWGERASYDATAAKAELQTWEAMAKSMEASESALNTITLILPDLKELYGNNLRGLVIKEKEKLNQSQDG